MAETKPIRIPFDSFTLSAVVDEVRGYLGGKVQDVRQPNDFEISIGLYSGGKEAMLLISCHPEFARAHFITKRLVNQPQPPVFCSTIRSRLDGARLVHVEQVQGDRLLQLGFEAPSGDTVLIAELMGKHSNLILTDGSLRILSAIKWVGKSKSSRPIQPNAQYELPPVMKPGETGRRSPFLTKLLASLGQDETGPVSPILSPGHGAYPISVASLGLAEFHRSSISVALEQYFDLAIPQAAADSLRSSLLAQTRRNLLAKEVALAELGQAADAGDQAPKWQRMGELVLAYGGGLAPKAETLQAWDYDGAEVSIKLDPDLDFKANANRYFERAKRAKGSLGIVRDQIARLSTDHVDLASLVAQIEVETKLERLREFERQAISRRWINLQTVQAAKKEDRPYQGHRIRELTGPGGYSVLFGENAESNDFLTLRVAKPNDLWLHIRGSTSAHVVIVTKNQPDRVQPETLRFAARIAVLNSPSKHGGYVPVDYTLKKYVRRPKGAAAGAAVYTNEKTIHVDGEQR